MQPCGLRTLCLLQFYKIFDGIPFLQEIIFQIQQINSISSIYTYQYFNHKMLLNSNICT